MLSVLHMPSEMHLSILIVNVFYYMLCVYEYMYTVSIMYIYSLYAFLPFLCTDYCSLLNVIYLGIFYV